MQAWQSLRSLTLIALSGTTLAVLGKIILVPHQAHSAVTDYQFPSSLSLQDWQILSSGALAQPIEQTAQPTLEQEIASHWYELSQDNRVVRIEAHYVLKPNANVHHAIQKYGISDPASAQLPLRTQSIDGIGSYVLFTHDQTAYLGSCINPQGESTVTSREFKRNRNFADLQHRLLPWLLGEELKDERCLWSFLSMPLQNDATKSHEMLKDAWVAWYSWWSDRFPPL